MKAHNIAPSTSEAMLLINGWIAQGRFDRARQALNLMTEAGLAPSRVMYVPLVSAFAEARRFKEANEIAIEALLRAQGRWEDAVRTYLEDRGETA